ncbi:MAG: DNA polymerase III subunit gamma/tau [Planctomycetota bacterium]
MSHSVLARKYRPRTFEEVVGQEHVVKALSRALERERLAQAYLLVGPRGVGKTSTARILARSLNCEKGPTLRPCLACPACTEIDVGADPDVVEIDGASNNGVDDIRALRERVHYHPLRDRRKIYIIDEVQRLSGPAFDALLKTLEEPPGHALFLFATTDPHKIPETIVSRCQVFEFRRLREEDVHAKLGEICRQEGVEVGEDILQALARGCRGGLRDAESMLDQVLSVAEEAPTLEDLESIAGLARPERWLDLLEAVEGDDAPCILQVVEAFLSSGGTERDFVEQAVEALRDLLHLILLGEEACGVPPPPERRERLLALGRKLGRERVEALMGLFFSLESRMTRAPLAARALLEWTLLRAARLARLVETGSLLAALQKEQPPETARRPAVPGKGPPVGVSAVPKAPPGAGEKLLALLETVRRKRPTLGVVLKENLLRGRVGPGSVEISLKPLPARDRNMIEDPLELRFLEQLPQSPGPWKIRFEEEASSGRTGDRLGQELQKTFGGGEELP